jgi:hypothetical protein
MKTELRSLVLFAALTAACSSPDPNADAGMDAAADASDPLPNLIPVIRNPQFQRRGFAPDSCEVDEGCTVPGYRRLLRFDLFTPNVGQGDLYFGNPSPANRPLSQFEWGRCHNHWHLRGYADYRLFDMHGNEVGRGHKQSFCLEDTGPWMGMGAPRCRNRVGEPEDPPGCVQTYGCGNQGIHSGYYDLYNRSLACQYVDVTDVPPGQYILRASINVERTVREASYDDNVVEMMVEVTDPGPGGPPTDPTLACEADESGLDRECGWTAEPEARSCTPGAMVEVGCNAGCTPALGSCEGDPMIRVCEGSHACMHLDAMGHTPSEYVGQNDDACGTRCSRVSFTCPASGAYTVMTASYRSGSPSNCVIAAR